MDNKKIGSFIAERRKGLGLTQLELANKLSITDRAISKWENGRGMPDISLIKPLCDELKITVNELLSGEKLEEGDNKDKYEQNIINTLEFSHRKQKNYKKIIITIIVITLIPIIIFSTLFCIDVYCMKNNKQVFFSTWGFKYYPPIDLKPEMLELTIENYLSETLDKKYEDEKYFIAAHVFLIKENKPDKLTTQYIIYAWMRGESRRMVENNILDKVNGFSIPYKFIVEKIPYDLKNGFQVVEAIYPVGEAEEYERNLKNIFPKSILKEIETVHNNEIIPRLTLDIDKQIKQYYDLNP